jgi:mxaD protein
MRNIILSLAVFCLTLPAYAHGPTPQKAKESITINAPVAKVWEAIKQFDAIANWHPDLKKSEGDGKNQSGGLRTLTFKNDASLVEELDYYSDQEHEYSYRLKTENTSAFPTSSHSVEIKVVHGDMADTSVVTGNTPPENLNDEAAVKAMTKFFQDGLNSLKTKVEQK